MANNQIRADQLVDGERAYVRGKIVYSRLTSLIDGKELDASIARSKSKYPTTKPHTRIVLDNAQVHYQDANVANNTEAFINERFFASTVNPQSGNNFSHDNKGTFLPTIAIPHGQGQVIQDDSGRDLAAGSDVTLVLRAYQAGDQGNLGLSLDLVMVNDPEVKYYSGSTNLDNDTLSALGVTFAAPPRPVNAADQQPVGETQPFESADTGTIVDEDGFAMPGPGTAAPAPAAPTQAPPVQAQPAPQAQQPVQAQPAQPAPAVAQPVPQAAAPAAPAQTSAEEENARLKAQIEAMQNAGSPVGAAAGAPAVGNPWTAGQAGISPQV